MSSKIQLLHSKKWTCSSYNFLCTILNQPVQYVSYLIVTIFYTVCDVILLFVEDENYEKRNYSGFLSVTELSRKVPDQQHSVYTDFLKFVDVLTSKCIMLHYFSFAFFFYKVSISKFYSKECARVFCVFYMLLLV